MKLVATERGRVVVLFPVEDMRPLAGLVLVDSLQALLERYEFRTIPSLSETDISKGIIFKNGAMTGEDSRIAVDQLAIYNDGLAADASTTDIAEKFLQDFIAWGKEKLSFRDLIRPPKKSYLSSLVVEFDQNIDGLINDIEIVLSMMSESFSSIYGEKPALGLKQISFGQDAVALPAGAVYPDFTIERRVGTPFEYNRFFSSAPLTTDAHIELLQAMEAKLRR